MTHCSLQLPTYSYKQGGISLTSRSSLVGNVARYGRHRPTMAPLCVRLRVSKHDALAAGGVGGKKKVQEGEDNRVNADVG